MKNSQVVLFGVGSSFLVDVETILERLDLRIAAYVANVGGTSAIARSTIAPLDVTDELRSLPCVIPLTTPGFRQSIVRELDELRISHRPPLLDPTAPISSLAVVEEGVVVSSGSVVGGEVRLERFCTVNRAASIGHHSVIEAFAAIGPGVTIPAAVTIEAGAFIGTGAVLLPHVTVGRNAIVGAGSVVVKDVDPNTVVVGNPARVIRSDIVGYNDVGVS